MKFDATFLFFDDDFALLRDFLADLAIAPGIDTTVEEADKILQPGTELLECPQPGHAGEHAPAGCHHSEQEQRRAGIADLMGENAADLDTEHAARTERQFELQGVEAQGFQRRTGDQQEDKTDQRHIERPALRGILRIELVKAPPDEHPEQHDPPPGGKTEHVEHQVGNPRAGAPGRVVHALPDDGVRPARIFAAEAPQGHRQEQGDGADGEPARLLQQGADFFRQGTCRIALDIASSHVQTPAMIGRSSLPTIEAARPENRLQPKNPEDTNHFPVIQLRDDYKLLSQTTWELGGKARL